MKTLLFLPLVASAFALGGCVASMAMGAASLAAQGVRGQPRDNTHLQAEAKRACETHAGQYGAVHVIDVEQRSISKTIVWGTVDDGKERRSFQCDFGTKMTGFKLRPIAPRR